MKKILSSIGTALFIATAMVGAVISTMLTREGADALGMGFWTACYFCFCLIASISLTATSKDARREWKSLGWFVIPALALLAFGTLNSMSQLAEPVSGQNAAMRESVRNFSMVPVYVSMYLVPIGVFSYLLSVVLERANQAGQPK